MTINADTLRSDLTEIDHPVLEDDIVSLQIVESVDIDNGVARITLAMNAPFAPAERHIGDAVVDTVEANGLQAEITATWPEPTKDLLPEVRNTLVVAAGKGGVGKTTVAVNLAAGLADKGARVGLLDADVHGPNVPRALSMDEGPMEGSDGSIIPPERHGLAVISMGMLLQDEDDPVILRGPMLNDIRTQFIETVTWGPLDYLVIDLPPGTGDGSLDVLQSLDVTGAVIVTTPHPMAQDDARKAIHMFDRHETPILGVIENMASVVCPSCDEEHRPLGPGGIGDLVQQFGVDHLGTLPFDRTIGTASEPVAWSDTNPLHGRITRIIDETADRVSAVNATERIARQSDEQRVDAC